MKQHKPRFIELAKKAKEQVKETNVDEVWDKLESGHTFHLVDVREESEWARGHLPKAEHLGKGVIERDIENHIPDTEDEIVLYCGGGFRSALAAQALEQMGYKNVYSMDGGFSAWKESGYPLSND